MFDWGAGFKYTPPRLCFSKKWERFVCWIPMKTPRETVERIHPAHYRSKEKYLLYLRHVFAYEFVQSQSSETDHVLEIGFGDGYGTHQLAETAAQVTAVDVEPEAVAHAQQRYGSETCWFRTYDGTTLPFDDASFDLVVALQVIEHIEDDAGFAREACRVLKPGGLFICTTPNRAYRVAPGQPIWNPFHVREYLPDELDAVLRQVFPSVQVLGIRGDEEAQRLEINRARRGFSWRKLIPEPVKRWTDGDVTRRYSTASFHVIDQSVKSSLDLLALCRT